jgi:antitoxin HicB
MKFRFTVVLQREEDGGFSVSVPSLVGCYTQGETFEDAIMNARDAIEGHVASLIAHGFEVPVEIEPGIVVPIEIETDVRHPATAA